MALNCHYSRLLVKAAKTLQPTDFEEYFELKRLLKDRRPSARREFAGRFTNYYGLNVGGLTEAFKRRYFRLLFAFRPNGQGDPYTRLLLTLYRYPRRKGDRCLQASFVSKLVAIHDESRPLYDANVSSFFGFVKPSVGSIKFRVAGFVENLHRIKEEYESWAEDPHFARTTKALIHEYPILKQCHPVRLCDFLVWAVGAYGLE